MTLLQKIIAKILPLPPPLPPLQKKTLALTTSYLYKLFSLSRVVILPSSTNVNTLFGQWANASEIYSIRGNYNQAESAQPG